MRFQPTVAPVEVTAKPMRGRRRDTKAHQAILRATLEELDAAGYAGTTIEAIARRAGVGKATIYRWWESKGLLVYEAAFTGTEVGPLLDSGSLEGDLRALITGLVAEFAAPVAVAAIPGLLADFGGDENLRRLIRERFMLPARERAAMIFERAAERGDSIRHLPVKVVVDALLGAVFGRVALAGEPVDETLVEPLVQLIVEGVRG